MFALTLIRVAQQFDQSRGKFPHLELVRVRRRRRSRSLQAQTLSAETLEWDGTRDYLIPSAPDEKLSIVGVSRRRRSGEHGSGDEATYPDPIAIDRSGDATCLSPRWWIIEDERAWPLDRNYLRYPENP